MTKLENEIKWGAMLSVLQDKVDVFCAAMSEVVRELIVLEFDENSPEEFRRKYLLSLIGGCAGLMSNANNVLTGVIIDLLNQDNF